jgi:hypothetical protein
MRLAVGETESALFVADKWTMDPLAKQGNSKSQGTCRTVNRINGDTETTQERQITIRRTLIESRRKQGERVGRNGAKHLVRCRRFQM